MSFSGSLWFDSDGNKQPMLQRQHVQIAGTKMEQRVLRRATMRSTRGSLESLTEIVLDHHHIGNKTAKCTKERLPLVFR